MPSVLSADQMRMYGLFMTMPAGRTETTEEYQMKFETVHAEAPLRITAWFRPGETTGYQSIYGTPAWPPFGTR